MICIDCRSACAYPTGLLSYQRSLARHLPTIAPEAHFRLLRDVGAPGRLALHSNAHEVFVPGDPESPLAPLTLKRRTSFRGVGLFHATAGLYPTGLEVPVVTTVHDVLWLTKPRWLRPSGLTGPIIALACRRYVSDALRRSARIIAPSEATRRSIEEVAPEAAERLRVIPNGVDEAFGPLDPTDQQGVRRVRDTCARLLGGAWRFVLDVGRAAAYRNHAGLVRAFASAFRSDSTVHLVLVQAIGEQATSSTKLAARLGIEGRVHVASGVASRDLVALYQGAICLCHPSLHESFGTVVAEAMACGCPVITSGRAASGEVAEGVAQLVNPEHEDEIAAAMKRVAYEPGVADRMRARGLDRAERISARATAAATWQVYRELLGTAS